MTNSSHSVFSQQSFGLVVGGVAIKGLILLDHLALVVIDRAPGGKPAIVGVLFLHCAIGLHLQGRSRFHLAFALERTAQTVGIIQLNLEGAGFPRGQVADKALPLELHHIGGLLPSFPGQQIIEEKAAGPLHIGSGGIKELSQGGGGLGSIVRQGPIAPTGVAFLAMAAGQADMAQGVVAVFGNVVVFIGCDRSLQRPIVRLNYLGQPLVWAQVRLGTNQHQAVGVMGHRRHRIKLIHILAGLIKAVAALVVGRIPRIGVINSPRHIVGERHKRPTVRIFAQQFGRLVPRRTWQQAGQPSLGIHRRLHPTQQHPPPSPTKR